MSVYYWWYIPCIQSQTVYNFLCLFSRPFSDENVESFFYRVTSMAFNDIMRKSLQDETDGKAMKKVIAADSSLICESLLSNICETYQEVIWMPLGVSHSLWNWGQLFTFLSSLYHAKAILWLLHQAQNFTNRMLSLNYLKNLLNGFSNLAGCTLENFLWFM